MPRYFFKVTDGGQVIDDPVGATYRDTMQACEAAERIAVELSEDASFSGCSIEVLNEDGVSVGNVIIPK